MRDERLVQTFKQKRFAAAWWSHQDCMESLSEIRINCSSNAGSENSLVSIGTKHVFEVGSEILRENCLSVGNQILASLLLQFQSFLDCWRNICGAVDCVKFPGFAF